MKFVRLKTVQRSLSPSASSSSSSESGDVSVDVNESASVDLSAVLIKDTSDSNETSRALEKGLHKANTLSRVGTRIAHFLLGCLGAGLVVLFSLWFPFRLAPEAATKTYLMASYQYNHDDSHFDNTIWTYGTDYFLGAALFALSLTIPLAPPAFVKVGKLTRSLLLSYVASVIAGGLAHQYFLTVESRNTQTFRVLWTVCVGTVALATGFMGAIATELLRYSNSSFNLLPVVPGSLWVGFASCVTAMVAAGCFSYQRPACDIFIVGITQFPSTFYMVPALMFEDRADWRLRMMGIFGFLLNAPLLPLYPILVQYTDWSLSSINTLLHCWLLVAWSMQGISLRAVGKAWAATNQHVKKD